MQRQQQTVQQHLASLSEQDRHKFNQLSYDENFHYLAQHNLLEHDTESESEFSDSDSESEDDIPDLCEPGHCEWTTFPHLDPDTKSESELSKISKSCQAKLISARPKATNGANEVCNILIA